MQQNWLDKAVAAVAPRAGASRVRARLEMAAMQQAMMHYDGASTGRRTDGWRRVSTDANVAVQSGAARQRNTARDMVRNDPIARRAKEVITHNVVGPGIIPRAKAKTDEATARYEDLIVRHFDTTDIDAAGRHDLYGLQQMVMAAVVESGEALVRRRRRVAGDGLAVPFQIHVLEADFLDSRVDGPQPNGNSAVQGVEFDVRGRRVAYWLFDEHPGGAGWKLPQSRRVPAEDVAHIYRADRPGQVRGMTWFAPVMLMMKDFADYRDARLMREKIAACFTVFEEDADLSQPGPLGQKQNAAGEEVDSVAPGMVVRLAPGRTVKFASPPNVTGYNEYVRSIQQGIAAGVGITYEALTGDLSGVNFSSGRMGWLESHRNFDSWQQHLMITQMCRPVERWFIEACGVSGRVDPVSIGWTPPRREMINPSEEIPSTRDAIRSGLETPSSAVQRLGRDPREFFSELAADFKVLDDLGLTLDCDPRRVSRAGLTQARPQGSVLPGTDSEE